MTAGVVALYIEGADIQFCDTLQKRPLIQIVAVTSIQ